MTDKALHRERAIRVFISSTFRDMKQEREELVKRVFPQLRSMCDRRGVQWGAVDLRWGITDEQGAEGKVLPICFSEIDGCRPFFIGMLGERYGWLPDDLPRELIEKEPWLSEHPDCSVTELEILHGVLNDKARCEHAFFYFRDPSHVDSIPESKRQDFIEGVTNWEIERYGIDMAARRAENRGAMLESLKERIRETGLPVRENYKDPKHLGDLVLEDFTGLINRLYPLGTQLDPLERDALEHEAYAQARFRIYIPREKYYEQLNEHATSTGRPLVILGESGAGKSALLANWASEYQEAHPDELFISHYIGATPYSSDWASMLRRIMGELGRRFDIQGEIPTEPDRLRTVFTQWLHMASASAGRTGERVILVLDALNQLEDKDSALDLVWLPPYIPENIRLIVSTLPGRSFDALSKRDWPALHVEPLDDEERRKLIRQYIGQYRKTLSEERIERIASSPQTMNPLYLRALLEELRIFGVHENLDRVIEHYISSKSVPELFEKVLKRLERDCEPEWPGLIEDAMTFIWASRRGLSEEELLELLGAGGNPLPRAQWIQFYTAVEKLIVSRSGFITFVHNYIREAIQHRYLPGEKERVNVREKLAGYIADKEICPRKIDELPWLLMEAGSWRQLHDLLSDPGFFTEAWDKNRFEVKRYWSKLQASSELRLVDAFRRMLDNPDDVPDKDVLLCVSDLLADTNHHSEVLSLLQYLANYYRRAGDSKKLADCLRDQARIYYNRGHLDGALALLKEQERISREFGDLDGISRSLGNQAIIHMKRGDYDSAMELHVEEERICRELGDSDGLYRCLGNQALIHKNRGELDKSMTLYMEVERLCRELGDPGGLWRCMGNQASILKKRGDYDRAIKLLKERERICRELGDTDGLQRSLGNQADILIETGDLDGAMELLREQETLCREIDNPEGLSYALAYQAKILEMKGKPDEALPLAEQAYRLATKHGYAHMLEEAKPVLERIRSRLL